MQISLLEKLSRESLLFSKDLSRTNLLSYTLVDSLKATISINVWRNHAFESLIPLVIPFLGIRNISVEFNLSDYDDTFLFRGLDHADIELIWLDPRSAELKLTDEQFIDWLVNRVTVLRLRSNSPVIIATWCSRPKTSKDINKITNQISGVYFADIGSEAENNNLALLDERLANLTGSSLARDVQLVIAQKLACHWIPASILPPIKAICVDLDNTLHLGILGEDGIDGVELTPGHIELHSQLKQLANQGIFLVLVSKNDKHDVCDLFIKRNDYKLAINDFSLIEVGWETKSESILRTANELRIDPSSIIFVDDNAGELSSVHLNIPNINLIYATSDAITTAKAINFYPGVWRWRHESDDFKRIFDMRINSERSLIQDASKCETEYFKSLETSIKISCNSPILLGRFADLCIKTNQFNLALKRYNIVELERKMNSNSTCVAGISLRDKLSDSGVIAILVCDIKDDILVVDELCISCRALGRQLEDTIIFETIKRMPIAQKASKIAFTITNGPRNLPALKWYSRISKQNLPISDGLHHLSIDKVMGFTSNPFITIQA